MTLSDTLAALKLCPFCGSAPIMNKGDYYAVCLNCGAEGPWFEHDEDKAIAAWNTRTGQLVPVPSVERVKEQVAHTLAEGMARWSGGDHITPIDVEHYLRFPSVGYHADRIATAVIAAMKEGRE